MTPENISERKDEKIELVSLWMELIDNTLSRQSVDISSRLMPACALFVDHAIVSFGSGEEATVPDAEMRRAFLLSKSFQEFFVIILDWFKERYGKAFSTNEDWTLTAVVLFSGTSFKMLVPVLYKTSLDPNTLNLKFSTGIEENESARDWIQNPPNWHKLPAKQNEQLRSEASWIAGSLRKIKSELITPDKPDDLSEALSVDVSIHIESAANHILDGRSYGLACWEAHQACEKILKLIIRQSGVAYRNTHELEELWRLLPADRKARIGKCDLSKLPTGKQAVTFRYSGSSAISLNHSYEYYKLAINCVSRCTRGLDAKHRLAGRQFTFRKPEFMP